MASGAVWHARVGAQAMALPKSNMILGIVPPAGNLCGPETKKMLGISRESSLATGSDLNGWSRSSRFISWKFCRLDTSVISDEHNLQLHGCYKELHLLTVSVMKVFSYIAESSRLNGVSRINFRFPCCCRCHYFLQKHLCQSFVSKD